MNKRIYWVLLLVIILVLMLLQARMLSDRVEALENKQSLVPHPTTIETPQPTLTRGYDGICDLYVVVCPDEKYDIRIQ